MNKLLILFVFLIGCNVTVIESTETEGSGGNDSSSSSGSGGSIIGIGGSISTNICLQKHGDCKFVKTCEKGNITWEPDLSDIPVSHNECTYFECKCSDIDCNAVEHSKLDGIMCNTNKSCLNGVCK